MNGDIREALLHAALPGLAVTMGQFPRRTTTLMLSLLILWAPPLTAQAQDTVPRRLWQRAAANHWHVRVIAGEDTLAGRVRYVRGQPLIAETQVPDPVLRIDRRLETGSGALIGGVAGLAVGAAFGAAWAAGASDDPQPRFHLLPAALLGGVGGAIGLLAGQVVAPGRIEWRTIWHTSDR